MILVGVVVILLSLRGLLSAIWSRLAALVREGIKTSLANLRTFPCIQTLEGKGRITLHGAYFDIASGTLSALDHATNTFVPV